MTTYVKYHREQAEEIKAAPALKRLSAASSLRNK